MIFGQGGKFGGFDLGVNYVGFDRGGSFWGFLTKGVDEGGL